MLHEHAADIAADAADSSQRIRHMAIEARIALLFTAVSTVLLVAGAYQLYDVYLCLSGAGLQAVKAWAGTGHLFSRRVLRAPAFSETVIASGVFSCVNLIATFICIVVFWNIPIGGKQRQPADRHEPLLGEEDTDRGEIN